MRWALLLLACGCNPLFGIEQTDLWDAAPAIDAPPPPSCPAIGTAPTFGTELSQVSAPGVTSFSLDASGEIATGVSYDDATYMVVPVIAVMPGAFAPATLKPEAHWPSNVRLAPEGDTMFVTRFVTDKYVTTPYHRTTDGWTAATNGVFAPANNLTWAGHHILSAPSRGPQRRFVTTVYDKTTGTEQLVELQYENGVATELWRHPVSALGITSMGEPNLSPDGLRLVFVAFATATEGGYGGVGTGTDGGGAGGGETGSGSGSGSGTATPQRRQPVMYLDRPTRDVPFSGTAIVIDAAPDYVRWPQLTEDCGRIYFHALDTTWYLKQAL